MYQNQPKINAVIALCYYVLLVGGFFVMGMLYARNIAAYDWVYWALFLLTVVIVLLRDRSAGNLGLANVKKDILLTVLLVVMVAGVGFLISEKPAGALFRGVWYYLIRIAFVEEVIFRGFLQNYLFGLSLRRKCIFLLGAVCFSLMHVPFQMYVNEMVSLRYFIIAWPQLLFTCCFHLIMCWIASKRGNILLPAAIHFAVDFLQAVL